MTCNDMRESEARLRAIFDSALDAIIAMDGDGTILEFNAAAERTFGHSREAVLGAKFVETIVPPPDRERQAQELYPRIANGESGVLGKRIEITAMRADGTEFPVELAITGTTIGGKPMFAAHLRDLTTRRMAEQSLRLRSRAIEASINGILIVDHRDPACAVEYANPAFRKITGYTADEIIGCSFEPLFRNEGGDAAMGSIREALHARREIRILLHNYRRLANYDGLTGLPNRVLFDERLARHIADCKRVDKPFILLFADVNELKLINDTLGHNAGDELLRGVATRLESCLRDGDTIARLGGDEFVIVLTRTDLSEKAIAAIVERVVTTVAAPMNVAGRELRVTCSVGVSRFPDHGVEGVDLLKHADEAMYRAKRTAVVGKRRLS